MLLFLIFALIIVSGLVAYLGDQIGMKIGKKRLSIFGIRPKYTSIIITIFTGIFIATISISLLMLASEGVRLAVFDMERLVGKLSSLNQQVEERDNRLKDMELEILDTTTQLSAIRQQKHFFQMELELKQEEFQYVQEQLAELSKIKRDLENSKITLDEKIIVLEGQRDELETKKKDLEKDVVALQSDVKILTTQLDETTKMLDDLTKKAMALMLRSEDYRQQSEGYQNQDIVYRKGDIVYMDSLDAIPGASDSKIVEEIENYLLRANRVAQKYPLQIREEDGRSILLQPLELYEVSRALVDPSYSKILVWIHAKKNILINNFVEGTITWEENYRVYHQNELIAQRDIDSNQNPTAIERQLRELLSEMSERSVERGLLPNPSGEVGSIDFVEFYQILEAIKSISGKVKITITASRDIWRQDSLSTANLNFQITPAGEMR